MRLGADRILVIGLSHESKEDKSVEAPHVDQFPSAPFLLGKILNALLLDKTEYDLSRLERLNAILEAGEKSYGPDFTTRLATKMKSMRGSPYRKVGTLMIRPTEDIAAVAHKHARLGSVSARAGGIIGPIIRRIANMGDDDPGDLLSYLLFDGEYATDLVRLGMRDADAKRQELIDFFSV